MAEGGLVSALLTLFLKKTKFYKSVSPYFIYCYGFIGLIGTLFANVITDNINK
jgi:hypothetical protein